jgi:hypothetical protein
MDRLSALPDDLQRGIWKGWVCDVVRRAYCARSFPRLSLGHPPLFEEVAYLADALWSASYALTSHREWLPFGEWTYLFKGMHPEASQASMVHQWLDLNVESIPSSRLGDLLWFDDDAYDIFFTPTRTRR